MKFPSINALEELYPDLVRFAVYRDSELKAQQNFIRAMKTAARMWTIERSLYEPESDIYLAIDSPSFKCATWEKLFKDRVPDYQQRTLAEFLLADRLPRSAQAPSFYGGVTLTVALASEMRGKKLFKKGTTSIILF